MLAARGPYTESALYFEKAKFLVLATAALSAQKLKITSHAESSKDVNYAKLVATKDLIETCACAVLI